jgi:hypothetical protein
MMSCIHANFIHVRINASIMSVSHPGNDDTPTTEWIGKYQIQPRGERGRAITIPQAVASEVAESVVVWSGSVEANDPYLRLAIGSLSETVRTDESFLGCRSVVTSGRGKRVVLPKDCDEDHFCVGTQVAIIREHSGNELACLKIIPEDVFGQTVSSVV